MSRPRPVIVAIIQARTGSSRFPKKVLADVAGEPMLQRVLERVSLSELIGSIVVATSVAEDDEVIGRIARSAGVDVHRGDEHDVLGRYVGAARQAGADIVVRITADCPLIDPRVIDAAIRDFLAADPPVDYLSNAVPRRVPDGMDVEVFSREALEIAGRDAHQPAEREHVTRYLHASGRFRVGESTAPLVDPELRLTVDYPQDLDVVRRVYTRLHPVKPDFSLEDIIDSIDGAP